MSRSTRFWRDPVLPYVETRIACHSRACYRPHSHPTFSIGAVDAGSSLFTGAQQLAVRLHPGSLVFIPPGCVHACNPDQGSWSYQMLHLDKHWLHSIWQEETGCHPPDDIPAQLLQTPAAYRDFCTLNQLLFSQVPAEDKEAALITFIGDYLLSADQARIALPAKPAAHLPELRIRLQQLEQAPLNLSLKELAQLAGLSRYQCIRFFRNTTGLTPHAWQLNQRINLARAALQQGKQLAVLAQDLDFADQSHFQRVFKQYTGVTPGQYLR